MTENFKSFPERVSALGSPESSGDSGPAQCPESPVTLKLPLEIANAIAQRMSQSGQTQAQVILETLALNLKETGLKETAQPDYLVLEELAQLKRRLTELETLIPKVVMLEGKSIAF